MHVTVSSGKCRALTCSLQPRLPPLVLPHLPHPRHPSSWRFPPQTMSERNVPATGVVRQTPRPHSFFTAPLPPPLVLPHLPHPKHPSRWRFLPQTTSDHNAPATGVVRQMPCPTRSLQPRQPPLVLPHLPRSKHPSRWPFPPQAITKRTALAAAVGGRPFTRHRALGQNPRPRPFYRPHHFTYLPPLLPISNVDRGLYILL